MTMTKATIQTLFQRAGGWCEPVQDRVFPLFESAVKAARFVSFIIRFERSPMGGNMGGNAEEITFRPSADVSMLTEDSTGTEGFCVIRARESARLILYADAFYLQQNTTRRGFRRKRRI